ncbi:MFS transporter [Planosporangium thailandense]|uniref:MFS transporter n=1 Tax=Planosporangium thailandense TaxID=765197 RepID=UPI0030B85243
MQVTLSAPTTTPSQEGHRLGTREYRRLAIALFAAGIATFSSLYCTQPLLPLLQAAYRITPAQAALSVSATTLALGVGMLLVSPLSDAFGRVRFMRVALGATAVVGLACAVAPNWPVLLVLRAVQGLALAGLPAVAMAYLREEVHRQAHARAAGLYIAGTAIGGMLGRLVAGGLADVLGWRAAVGGVALLALACAVTVFALLPASRRFVAAPASPARLARLTGRLLTDPVLLALDGIGAALMGAFVAVFNALGFRLAADPYRLSAGVAGLVFLVYPIGSLASALAGRAAGRFGQRPVVPAGVVIMAAGGLLTLAGPLPLIIAGLAVLTFGFFAAHGVASGWVAARAQLGGGGTGQASALYLLAYYLGSSVFGALSGRAWSAGGWPAVTAMTVALTVAGGLLALALTRTRPLAQAAGERAAAERAAGERAAGAPAAVTGTT